MQNVRELMRKINIGGAVNFAEPMEKHTSFRIGGPAEVFVTPNTIAELVSVFSLCLSNHIPFFLLGGGSNILVSDRGMAGVVINLAALKGIYRYGNTLTVISGTPMRTLVEKSLEFGLAGLESFHRMPGTVGGAVWMNARCYGSSVSDVLISADIIDENLKQKTIRINKDDFGYKVSPFQSQKSVILRVRFQLNKGNRSLLTRRMEEISKDRTQKGHFDLPSGGSAFKNNRMFGEPTGKLIEALGLKGFGIGGALISPRHANLIVNTGGAKANDVLNVLHYIEDKVYMLYGFELERELLIVGKWEEDGASDCNR